MEEIQFARGLVPLLVFSAVLVLQKHRKTCDDAYVGQKHVGAGFLVQLISWFMIFVSSLLFSQLVIDAPSSIAMVLCFGVITVAVYLIALQQLSLRYFFNDKHIAVTSMFAKTTRCFLSEVLNVTEKYYASNGGGSTKVVRIQLKSKRIMIPISMLGGANILDFERLLAQLKSRMIKDEVV